MWEYLHHLSFWDWLAFGTLLLILEVFGAGGYLLWSGVAAAVVGLFAHLTPGLHWSLQFILFAALSLATAIWWRRRHRAGASRNGER